MNTFSTTRDAAIEIMPTQTSLEIGQVENTADGKVINVRVIQTEFTAFGTKTQDETKKFPIAMQSVIIGYDVESKEPIYDLPALKIIFKSFGINLI